MKIRAQNIVLGVGALSCFLEIILAPKGSDPGPVAAAVMGILLVRRAIVAAPQPLIVIVSGCLLTLLVVAGDHGVVNINKPVWIVMILAGGACYGFWERIEKVWR